MEKGSHFDGIRRERYPILQGVEHAIRRGRKHRAQGYQENRCPPRISEKYATPNKTAERQQHAQVRIINRHPSDMR